jgi:hypothetical protein
MNKVEKFIQEYTRNCSNEIAHWDIGGENVKSIYSPWLTPDQARRAVEIAREETTEEIKQLLKENYLIKSVEPLRWVSWEKVFNDLKQAMKNDCK